MSTPIYDAILNAVAAALAEARRGAGWQPIETAPNDYTVILLYQPAGPGTAEAVGQGHRIDLRPHAHDKWIFQVSQWLAQPTHWQPLPEPPALAAPDQGEADERE